MFDKLSLEVKLILHVSSPLNSEMAGMFNYPRIFCNKKWTAFRYSSVTKDTEIMFNTEINKHTSYKNLLNIQQRNTCFQGKRKGIACTGNFFQELSREIVRSDCTKS